MAAAIIAAFGAGGANVILSRWDFERCLCSSAR
jgi:hypothetical protein